MTRRDYTKPTTIDMSKSQDSTEPTTVVEKPKMFISLPMNGLTDEEVHNEINRIASKFKEKYDIIDTFIQEESPHGSSNNSGVWYLGRSIQLLSSANIVVFHKNWSSARGCVVEHRICELYNIPYIEMI